MRDIELNGRTYQEADHGRFDASLIDNGEEIARTNYDRIIWYSGLYADVCAWAEYYGIDEEGIEEA